MLSTREIFGKYVFYCECRGIIMNTDNIIVRNAPVFIALFLLAAGVCAGAGTVEDVLNIDAPDQRFDAVMSLQDEQVLTRIAREDSDWRIRYAAVGGINAPDVLGVIAVEDGDWYVRRRALKKLDDSSVLKNVALNDNAFQVRLAAVGNLVDQGALSYLAAKDEYYEVRAAAAGRLTDQQALARIALADDHHDVRAAALGNLKSQDILQKIALNDPNEYVRSRAAGRVTDHDVLIEIVENDEDLDVRLQAVDSIQDKQVLGQIAVDDPHWMVRSRAMERVPEDTLRDFFAERDDFYLIPRMDFEVNIDGDLSEWKAMEPIIVLDSEEQLSSRGDNWKKWDGPEDLSAEFYKAWCDSFLYIAIMVRDDKHYNVREGRGIWDGDCVQFALNPLGTDFDTFNIVVALASDRVQTQQFRGSETGILENGEFVVVRDEGKGRTFYEMKLPLASLGLSPDSGVTFGYNAILFDDDDGEGMDYWIQITDGIAGGSWAPERFPNFILF